MENEQKIKTMVRETYAKIAEQSKEENQSSCCGTGGCCDDSDYTIFSDDYTSEEGYHPDADMGLGCGMPVKFSRIKKGDTVVDLGAGAGNDAFVARAAVGDEGKVIGVDMTPEMLKKARANNEKLGFKNVEFLLGEIENMPIQNDTADVVISNCVLNLVPNKLKAFSEIFRILKTGGQFTISDVVLTEKLPKPLLAAAEMYAGCVSGAMLREEYLEVIQKTGFKDLNLLSEKNIVIPEEILSKYLSPEDIAKLKNNGAYIQSITVSAVKPTISCCGPSGCC